MFEMAYPTPIHQHAAETIVQFWHSKPVDAVILTNSCARGVATPESDLDLNVLLPLDFAPDEQAALEAQWHAFYATQPIFEQLKQLGKFVGVHLDCFKADWQPETWDDGGGPDGFELNVGNALVYSAPLWQRDAAFDHIRTKWLPYYNESLRQQRLAMVRDACAYDLEHVAFFVQRELYFQGFDRLYKAFQEFLQVVFIARSTYPIAYNKWIRQQIETILGLPELYIQLPPLLQISCLESRELVAKATDLQVLLEMWAR